MPAIFVFPGLFNDADELKPVLVPCSNHKVTVVAYPSWATTRHDQIDMDMLIAHCREQIGGKEDVLLLGYSFGGHVAFAVAADFIVSGQTPPLLALLDTSADPYLGRPPSTSSGEFITRIIDAVRAGDLYQRLNDYVARILLKHPWMLNLVVRRHGTQLFKRVQMYFNRPILNQILAWTAALTEPFPMRAVLLRCQTQQPGTRGDLGWHHYIKVVQTIDIPGNHVSVVRNPKHAVSAGIEINKIAEHLTISRRKSMLSHP